MSHQRYVIMANGKGTRWGGHLGIPKQLIEIEGETLLRRIVRQVSETDPQADIVISSSDHRHDTVGARRHEPERNEIELDRFVNELLVDDTCFLYGDTFYMDAAIQRIAANEEDGIEFFGDERSIVGVSVKDSRVMRVHLDIVREAYLTGHIDSCIGWQVYQSYEGQLGKPLNVNGNFTSVAGNVAGFNSPEDLRDFMDHMGLELENSN